jgi:glycosyltransferase involved in cell wall biosynthesis
MTSAARVSIGLPVYNAERYLRQSLDDLLAQTLTDFELIISDNASTDATAAICQEYAARDPRIRYVRQARNLGAVGNHRAVAALARAPYFKFASHDDRYDPDLLRACVEALEAHPEAVLAHSWHRTIDGQGEVISADPYPLDTANPSPRARLRSVLRVSPGGTDFYGIVRTEVLRSVRPQQDYYNSDRTFVAELALAGPFVQVPRVLFSNRQHEAQASHGSRRARATKMGVGRSNPLVHPMARMYVEYAAGFVRAVLAAPLSTRERWVCLAEVAGWLVSAARTRLRGSGGSATGAVAATRAGGHPTASSPTR